MQNSATDFQPGSLPLLWAAAFLLFSALYVLTAQTGVAWQDSGMFQWRVLSGDYTGTLGIALAHPAYIALGRLFALLPAESFTASLHYASGIGMAVALANTAIIAAVLTGHRWIGFAAAVMLAVMHTVWWLATIAEVYTWHAAIFTAELLVLIKVIRKPRWQTAALLFFLNGFNLSIHNLSLLPLPVYGGVLLMLIEKKRLRFMAAGVSVIAYAIGASFFILLVSQQMLETGDITRAFCSALFGTYAAEVLNTNASWHYLKINAALIALNFLNAVLPFALLGWRHMKRQTGGYITGAFALITALELFFVIRYPVPDQFTFVLPSLILLAVAAAVGISVLSAVSKIWRNTVVALCALSVLVPPIVYASAPALINTFGLAVQRARELPFRDEMRYWIVPWKHNENSAELFAQAALQEAAPHGTIVCDSTSYYPLKLLQQYKGLSPGVAICQSWEIKRLYEQDMHRMRESLQEHPLFVLSPALAFLPADALHKVALHREQGRVLYKVTWQED
jgi:hypothetical protein